MKPTNFMQVEEERPTFVHSPALLYTNQNKPAFEERITKIQDEYPVGNMELYTTNKTKNSW